MLLNALFAVLSQEPQHGSGHAASAPQHGEEMGAGEFIMHHISDNVIIELPTVLGVDLSITKHVLMMWIVAAILMVMLPLLFRRKSLIPRGLASLFEAIVLFLREDIVENYLGKDGRRYEPYLFTVFFFILFCNIMGLVPGAASATGNISVTATLAVITFVYGLSEGMRHHGVFGYFKGLIPPGLPIVLVPLMAIVELMSLLTKHFALAIRLFANMTAGHVVIFSLIGLIFMFKSYLIAPIPVLGAVAISLLELLVALIQAYIFTLLSAVFIGAAVHQEH